MSVFDQSAVSSLLDELASVFNYAAYSIRNIDIEYIPINKGEFANAFSGIADKLATFRSMLSHHP